MTEKRDFDADRLLRSHFKAELDHERATAKAAPRKLPAAPSEREIPATRLKRYQRIPTWLAEAIAAVLVIGIGMAPLYVTQPSMAARLAGSAIESGRAERAIAKLGSDLGEVFAAWGRKDTTTRSKQ